MKKNTVSLLLILLGTLVSMSQSIPSNRTIDWSNAGVDGGIPCFDNIVVMTNLIGDGETDNNSVLQDYVDDYAGTNTKLLFPAGDFFIDGKIQIPRAGDLIIMGDSPSTTTLLFDMTELGKEGCFEIDAGGKSGETAVNSGASFGSKSITVTDVSGFAVGDWIEVDMDNPSVITENDDWVRSWAERSLGQLFKIVNISGNTIELDRSFRHDYDDSLNILARKVSMTENVGFENFKLEVISEAENYNFFFKRAANCWLKLIHSEKTSQRHVNLPISANCSIVDCYFNDSWNHGNGGFGYGLVVDLHTTDCLIENNIFNRLRHSMMCKLGANGNVFAYNYSHDPFWTNNDNSPPDGNQHGHLPHMNLFEGNVLAYIGLDDVWGPAWDGTTYFRNRQYADDRNVELNGPNLNVNILGNELLNGATINNESDNVGTLMHGNIINRSVEWNSSYTSSLPDSYYLSEKPNWWGVQNWPPIGPEYTSGSDNNPAYDRFLSSSLFLDYYCGNERVEEVDPVITCETVIASSDDGNIAENVLDTYDTTRWSAFGIGEYLEFCFDDTISISSISVAFHKGDERSTAFDVEVSLDGINWETVLVDQLSSGLTLSLEQYTFNETDAWKMRFISNGNDSPSEWNSVTTIRWNEVITGVNDLVDEDINVYPNPVGETLTIESVHVIESLELVDLNGRVLYSGNKLFSTSNEIDIPSEVYGVLVLVINLQNGDQIVRKVVK